jgi:hypothetical protein
VVVKEDTNVFTRRRRDVLREEVCDPTHIFFVVGRRVGGGSLAFWLRRNLFRSPCRVRVRTKTMHEYDAIEELLVTVASSVGLASISLYTASTRPRAEAIHAYNAELGSQCLLGTPARWDPPCHLVVEDSNECYEDA